MTDEFSKQVGIKLKVARTNEGLTQAQVAERIGIGTGSINQWESGRSVPTLPHLRELCRVLNHSANHFLGVADEQVDHANGLEWRVVRPYPVDSSLVDEIERGIELFELIVKDKESLATIVNRYDKFVGQSENTLLRQLKIALSTQAIQILNVNRDEARENKLLKKYHPILKRCIVAGTDQLPNDPVTGASVRNEAVAFLAARDAVKELVGVRLVGLTGGTTISRFVDLVAPASPRLRGITWVSMLASKGFVTAIGATANSVVARMVSNQPGSTGYQMPFVSMVRRSPDYYQHAVEDERNELDLAHNIRGIARQVEAAFISVGSPDTNLVTFENHLALPELMTLLERMPREERERCCGDILLHLVDAEGCRIGNTEDQLHNDAFVYSTELEDLKNISKRGLVWVIAARTKKADVIHGSLKSALINGLVIDAGIADALLDK